MATKTYFIYLFLATLSLSVFAKSDKQQLAEWTIENENKLLINYPTIKSTWFEVTCLELAKSMHFNQLNQCRLFKSDHINAYVFNNGHVYFSSAMMALINNKHQWASILAHENAHIELQHYLKTLQKIKQPGFFFPKRKIKKLIRNNEQEADNWSEKKLQEYGFQTNQIVFFLKRVKTIQAKNKSKTHLKLSKRITTTKKPEILDEHLRYKLSQF